MSHKPDTIRRTNPPPGDKPVLLYDGRCRFCVAQVNRLARHSRGRFVVQSFHDDGALEAFPGLTMEDCMAEMKLVDLSGRISGGLEAAVRTLGHAHPVIGKVLYLYYIPGLRWIADRAYDWVARNR